MSRFENSGKKYLGKFVFIIIVVALLVVLFFAQRNTGTPRKMEVPINLPAAATVPAVQTAPVLTTPAAIPPSPPPATQENNAGKVSSDETKELELLFAQITTTPPSDTAQAHPTRRPTSSKIPVAPELAQPSDQPGTPLAENANASGHAVAKTFLEETWQPMLQTAVSDLTQAILATQVTQETTVTEATTSAQATVEVPEMTDAKDVTDTAAQAAAEAVPQVASVAVEGDVVRFRFAEAQNHVADGAKNALEGVASAAKSGRYVIISPFYAQEPQEAVDKKLIEQRIVNIKKILADLNAPEQQMVVLKPQAASEQNPGDSIDVFAVQTHTYSDEQVWKFTK